MGCRYRYRDVEAKKQDSAGMRLEHKGSLTSYLTKIK
jgi:hypothetical protein